MLKGDLLPVPDWKGTVPNIHCVRLHRYLLPFIKKKKLKQKPKNPVMSTSLAALLRDMKQAEVI